MLTRMDRRILLVVGCAALASVMCGGDSGSTPSSSEDCQAYLDCLARSDPDMFEAELPIYGEQGSCFAGSSADTCNGVCMDKLAALDASCGASTSSSSSGFSETFTTNMTSAESSESGTTPTGIGSPCDPGAGNVDVDAPQCPGGVCVNASDPLAEDRGMCSAFCDEDAECQDVAADIPCVGGFVCGRVPIDDPEDCCRRTCVCVDDHAADDQEYDDDCRTATLGGCCAGPGVELPGQGCGEA